MAKRALMRKTFTSKSSSSTSALRNFCTNVC